MNRRNADRFALGSVLLLSALTRASSAEAAPSAEVKTSTVPRALSAEDRRLADALTALTAGDAQRALGLLEPSAGTIDDFRAILRARALLAVGKNDRAFAALDAVKPRAAKCARTGALEHPLYTDVVTMKARILGESEPTAAAELLAALDPTPEILVQMLELHRRAGELGAADAIEARMLVETPESPEAKALAKQLRAAGVAKRLQTPEQRMERVRKLLDTHQNLDARIEANALLGELGTDARERCELIFIAGKAERKLRDYTSALKSLAAARDQCLKQSQEDFALKASLLEVQVRGIRGHLKESKKLTAWLATTYPAHSFVDDALMFYASSLEDLGRAKDASAIYKQIAEMPGGDQAPEALWRLAYLAVRADDRAEAEKRLEAILARGDVPVIERARARYWLARTIEKSNEARARSLDEDNLLQLSFYGFLALDRLRATKPARAAELEQKLRAIRDAEAKSPPPPSSGAAISRSPEYERAMRLASLGAAIYAEGELELLACDGMSDEDALELALAFDAIGAHRRAQELLRARQATMLAGPLRAESLRVWRAAYSRPFAEEMAKASKESKVEELFLWALSREESTFDPEIVSWAGAVGLAQLMPGTAVLAHLALKLGRLDPERLTEPELNLRLGARVLKDGLSDFGALEPLALVAYNAGPGAARKLIDEKTAKPFDRWVEEIGIRETRKYVKRVLETWGVYRYLYDADRPFIPLPDSIGGGTP